MHRRGARHRVQARLGRSVVARMVVGLTAPLAQDIVPAAAALASEAQRGKTVGTVMTGLLLGSLLSRVTSGLIAQQGGWRSVCAGAALAVCMQ